MEIPGLKTTRTETGVYAEFTFEVTQEDGTFAGLRVAIELPPERDPELSPDTAEAFIENLKGAFAIDYGVSAKNLRPILYSEFIDKGYHR